MQTKEYKMNKLAIFCLDIATIIKTNNIEIALLYSWSSTSSRTLTGLRRQLLHVFVCGSQATS